MPLLQIYKKMSDSSKRLFEAEEQCGLYAVARSSKVTTLEYEEEFVEELRFKKKSWFAR